MRRRYYQSRGKGWFGDPERHRQSALGVSTGSKRESARRARERMVEMQAQYVPPTSSVSVAPVEENVPSRAIEEPVIEAREPVQSVLSQDDGGGGPVGQEVSTTTSTNGLFRPTAPPLFLAQKRKRYYAYSPTYVAGDLPLIAGDAAGTVGASVVSWIPVAVPFAMLYGGAKLMKGTIKKVKR